MAKWLKFILQEGIAEDGIRIIEPDDLQRLWYAETAYDVDTFTKPIWPVSDSSTFYALSYVSGYYRGVYYYMYKSKLYLHHKN